MNTINELVKEAHENAVAHGWWDSPPSLPEVIALCHSELSEALEEYRNKKPLLYYNCNSHDTRERCPDKYDGCQHGENKGCHQRKPEGIATELADCVIRIFDCCGHLGVDLESVMRDKMEYNKTRPHRHGGKAI